MPETAIEQVAAGLRTVAAEAYPSHGELRNVRVVGHTPKPDHFIYDVVIDFAEGSERVAAKIYRAGRNGHAAAREKARTEAVNLRYVYQIFQQRHLEGVPRPLGDFAEQGAVVAEKFNGLPLQSIIMKAALLPGYADHGLLRMAARKSGEWLRSFHKATADGSEPFNADGLMEELEHLCSNCKGSGLEESSVSLILNGARTALGRGKKNLACSAVLGDFTPLNIVVGTRSVGISDYACMQRRAPSLTDAAIFMAAVEALEKYPFCNRDITTQVQQEFLQAFGVSPAEHAVLRVLKMKSLLGLFAQGRVVKESAERKKVMWATVMKKFIHQSATRSLQPAA